MEENIIEESITPETEVSVESTSLENDDKVKQLYSHLIKDPSYKSNLPDEATFVSKMNEEGFAGKFYQQLQKDEEYKKVLPATEDEFYSGLGLKKKGSTIQSESQVGIVSPNGIEESVSEAPSTSKAEYYIKKDKEGRTVYIQKDKYGEKPIAKETYFFKNPHLRKDIGKETKELKPFPIETLSAPTPTEGEEVGYLQGIPSEFNRSLSKTFRTADNAAKYISDATGGWLSHGGIFGKIADKLEGKEFAPAKLPETFMGNVTKGVVGVAPLMIELAATPELEVPKILNVATEGLVKTFPKMATNSGLHGFIDTYAEKSKDKPIDLEGWKEVYGNTAQGIASGTIMHSLGYGAQSIGDLVNGVTGSKVLGKLSSAVANSTGFGGHNAYEQYITKGNVDLGEVAVAAGTGVGLDAIHLVPEIAKAAYGKAQRSFFDSSNEAVKLANENPKSVKETRDAAIELGEKASMESDEDSKNELLVAKQVLDKTADIKAVTENIIAQPEKYIQDILNDDTLTPEERTVYIDKIHKTVADNDPIQKAAKPINEEITALQAKASAIESNPHLRIEAKKIELELINTQIEEKTKELKSVITGQKLKEDVKEDTNGIPSEVGEGKEPKPTEPVEGTSGEKVEAGGVLEEQDKEVVEEEPTAEEKVTEVKAEPTEQGQIASDVKLEFPSFKQVVMGRRTLENRGIISDIKSRVEELKKQGPNYDRVEMKRVVFDLNKVRKDAGLPEISPKIEEIGVEVKREPIEAKSEEKPIEKKVEIKPIVKEEVRQKAKNPIEEAFHRLQEIATALKEPFSKEERDKVFAEREKIFKDNPKIKEVNDNFTKITKQLEEKGLIKKVRNDGKDIKENPCP